VKWLRKMLYRFLKDLPITIIIIFLMFIYAVLEPPLWLIPCFIICYFCAEPLFKLIVKYEEWIDKKFKKKVGE